MTLPRSVSFITCVADASEYALSRASLERLRSAGLSVAVEAVENPGNRYACPEALTLGRRRAPADLLVFCHQDVEFPPGWIDTLREQVGRIDLASGGNWGIAGTFGRSGRRFLGHVDDRHGKRREGEELPAPVETLDEHCLIARRALPLRFDESLDGFHL